MQCCSEALLLCGLGLLLTASSCCQSAAGLLLLKACEQPLTPSNICLVVDVHCYGAKNADRHACLEECDYCMSQSNHLVHMNLSLSATVCYHLPPWFYCPLLCLSMEG